MTDCLTAPRGPKMDLTSQSPTFVDAYGGQTPNSNRESPTSPQTSLDFAGRNNSFNGASVPTNNGDFFHLSDEDDESQGNSSMDRIQDDHLLGGCLEKKESERHEGVCGICQEAYTQPPRVLNCLHVFCETCLLKEQKSRAKPYPFDGSGVTSCVFRCPTCFDETHSNYGVKSLPLDYVLINRIDAEAIKKRSVTCTSCKSEDRAIARCQDCSTFLCACCEKAHSSMLCFENHKVVSFEVFDENKAEIHRVVNCLRHPKEIVQLYDPTCGTSLCNDCLMSGHQGHGCKKANEFDEAFRRDMRRMINETKLDFENFNNMEDNLSTALSDLQLARDSVRSSIEEAFVSYKAILDKLKSIALEELDKLHSAQESRVMDDIQNCSESRVNLEHSLEFAEKLIKYGDATEFLTLKQLVSSRIGKLLDSRPRPAKTCELRFLPKESAFEALIRDFLGKMVTTVSNEEENSSDPSRCLDEFQIDKRKVCEPPKQCNDLMGTPKLCENNASRTNTIDSMRVFVPPSARGGRSDLRKHDNLLGNNVDIPRNLTTMRGNDLVLGNDLMRESDYLRTTHFMGDNNDILLRGGNREGTRSNDFNLLNSSLPTSRSHPSSSELSNTNRLLSSDIVDAVHPSSISSSRYNSSREARSLLSSSPPPSVVASLPSLGAMRGEDIELNDLRSAMAQLNLARFASGGQDDDVDADVLPLLVGENIVPTGRMIVSPDMSSSRHLQGSNSMSQLDESSLIRNLSALAGLTEVSSPTPPLTQSSSSSVNGHRSPPQATVTILPPTSGPQPNPMPTRNRMMPMHIRTKFGQLGSGSTQFSSPHGFCLNSHEEIIVADTNNHRIQIFNKSGEFISEFGSQGKEEGQLWYPRKVAVMKSNGSGTYVVCDRGNERSRMQLFTRTGEFLRKIAIRYIDIVAGLALTSDGRIVAVDSVSPTVFVISEHGDLLLWFDCSEHMREPSDIAVWGSEFYICDFKGHCVVVYSESGNYLRRIGGEGLTNFPNGIDISDHGDILVGDSHGNRFHIVVFNREGQPVSEFECPYCKVSRCCGLKITSEGYVVTLAKNNHHVLILNTLYIH